MDPAHLRAEPSRGSPISQRLNRLLGTLRTRRPLHQQCQIVRQGSPMEVSQAVRSSLELNSFPSGAVCSPYFPAWPWDSGPRAEAVFAVSPTPGAQDQTRPILTRPIPIPPRSL